MINFLKHLHLLRVIHGHIDLYDGAKYRKTTRAQSSLIWHKETERMNNILNLFLVIPVLYFLSIVLLSDDIYLA